MRISAVTISAIRKRQIARLLFFSLMGLAVWSLIQSLFGGTEGIFRDFYLVPWTLLVFFVLLIPSVYLYANGRFSLFHPLVYPVWSYLFPAFVLGSLYFATGKYEPHFMKLIAEPERHIPMALFYVALGFACLSFGFAVNAAKRVGRSVSRRLPKWDWDTKRMILPFLLLLVIGHVFEFGAFAAGAIGYQLLEETTSIGNTYYYFSILGTMGNVLLWMTVFKAERLHFRHFLLILLLLLLIPYSVTISGGKGGLVRSVIDILFAHWASGRKSRLRHGIAVGCLLVLAVLVGFTYGTMFRFVKGGEANVSLAEHYVLWGKTLDAVREIDLVENLGLAAENAFQRFETITSFSVIVANYEKFRPLEGDYGFANNIWTYTWTAFIPRIVWPEKPVISDARSLAALYFEVGDTSFAMTPMGDLLRNFGPAGIVLGMALLGFVLRILYAGLIEGHGPSPWRSVTYYLLLTTVSYESFYGTIFPGLLRVGLIALIGGVLVNAASAFRDATRNALHAR